MILCKEKQFEHVRKNGRRVYIKVPNLWGLQREGGARQSCLCVRRGLEDSHILGATGEENRGAEGEERVKVLSDCKRWGESKRFKKCGRKSKTREGGGGRDGGWEKFWRRAAR